MIQDILITSEKCCKGSSDFKDAGESWWKWISLRLHQELFFVCQSEYGLILTRSAQSSNWKSSKNTRAMSESQRLFRRRGIRLIPASIVMKAEAAEQTGRVLLLNPAATFPSLAADEVSLRRDAETPVEKGLNRFSTERASVAARKFSQL